MARSRKSREVEYAESDVQSGISSRAPGRRAAILSCAALCFVVTFAYAGGGWASVLLRLLTDGVLAAVWLACAAGVGAAVLRLLPIRTDDHAEAEHTLYIVTVIALGLGVFSLAALGLGLAGWLNRITAMAMLAIGGAAGVVLTARSRVQIGESIRDALAAPAGWAWLWLAAMPLLGMAVVAALLPPGVMWPGEPNGYDVVEYHLQIPREWYELGRIVPLRHNAFSFFPFNVEMHYLLAMHLRGGPWAGMYLAHFMHLAMVVLAVAAVYGFARRLAPTHAGATIAAVCVAAVPWMTQLGSIAYNEGGLLLFGTLAMGWAFRAVVEPSRRLGRFPVAGLLAGFACGCKLTAVPEVLFAVGGLSLLAVILTSRTSRGRSGAEPRIRAPDTLSDPTLDGIRGSASLRPRLVEEVPLPMRLAGVATFFLAGLLALSPWLIRNQLWAGNPVFPEGASILGKAHFSDTQVQRWRQAHSPRPDQRAAVQRANAWWRDVWASPQYGFIVLPAGLLAGLLASLSPRTENSPYSHILKNTRVTGLLLIAMFVALSVVWLRFTHLQGRFFILGVPIAGMLLALMPWGRMRVAGAGLAIVAAVVGTVVVHGPLADRLFKNNATDALGLENLPAVFSPRALEDVPSGAPIALAGDAKAFFYAGPMSRLSYRTVFDVDAKPGESVIDAWTRGAPADARVIVDPSELERFSRTYFGIPPLPEEDRGRGEAFVIPP